MSLLPSGWIISSIEESMEAIIDYRGKTPSKTTFGIPLITAKIIGDGQIAEPNEFIAEEDYLAWMRRGLPKVGDVLITTEAPLGEVAQLSFDKVALAQRVILLRGKPGKLDNAYLKHVLQYRTVQEQLRAKATGSTVLGIKQSELRKVVLPLPPLEEQHRIAAILDKADAIRRKRAEAIRLTEELLRAAFLDMFGDPVVNPKGWEIIPMHKVIEKIEAGWSANGEEQPCKKDEWGVLKISAVTSGRFQPHENKVVKNIPPNKSLIIPKRGDLLFGRANTRELVAATCLVENSYERLFLPDKLWRIIPNPKFANTEYLRFLLSEPKYRGLLARKATGTSGSMLNVSQQKLLEMDAPIPHLDKQNYFAEVVWKIFGIRERLESAYNESNCIFNSLLHCAFRGEL